MNRPALKIGDVCKLSRKMKAKILHSAYYRRNDTLVVIGFGPFNKPSKSGKPRVSRPQKISTDDGHCIVQVISSRVRFDGKRINHKFIIYRKCLWFTGRNINDQLKASSVTQNKASFNPAVQSGPINNNGRTHCYKCGKSTETSAGLFTTYHLCKNSQCEWYDN